MLDRIFAKLEINSLESRTYLALLEAGPSTAGRLAQALNVPRSTLYGFLAKLVSSGLAILTEESGIKLWTAQAPEKIARLLNNKTLEWQEAAETFQRLMPELEARKAKDFITPRFSFYEGVEGVRNILEDVLLYRDSVTQCFWPAKDMMEILGYDYMADHNARRIRQNLHIQSIWPSDKMVDIHKNIFLGVGSDFKREIRQAPPGVTCSMGYWAYSNKVGFISSRRECFGFIVESMELREMLRTQFQVLWAMSQPVTVDRKITGRFIKERGLF